MKRPEVLPAYNEYPGFEIREISDNDHKIETNLWNRLVPEITPPSKEKMAQYRSVHEYCAWLISSGAWQNLPIVSDGSSLEQEDYIDDMGAWIVRTQDGNYAVWYEFNREER